jgi:hypothetical protein
VFPLGKTRGSAESSDEPSLDTEACFSAYRQEPDVELHPPETIKLPPVRSTNLVERSLVSGVVLEFCASLSSAGWP